MARPPARRPRPDGPRRPRKQDGRPRRDAAPARGPRPPRTEAERRAAEVAARRGPRPTRDREAEAEAARERAREVETWVDEGSVRAEAAAAADRAAAPSRQRLRDRPRDALERVDPEVGSEIRRVVGDQRGERLLGRLAEAAAALDRERFDDARRIVTPLVRELPGVAAVHEVAGLTSYRLGRWKKAAEELEAARALRADVTLLPVLADCYRALRRWSEVERVWDAVKAASPPHDVMTEARIVVAGALADRGRVGEAIALLESASNPPKRVRDHHLRQWYALADLHDRAGDPVAAARWFRTVAERDPDFVDVVDRLRALGR